MSSAQSVNRRCPDRSDVVKPVALFVLFGLDLIVGTVAFLRWWRMIVTDEWAVPLLLMMSIAFVAETILATVTGRLTYKTFLSLITLKVLAILLVGAGFTIQRMDDTPEAFRWGHATLAAVIVWEGTRFADVLRHFGVPLGPFAKALEYLATFTTPTGKLETDQKIAAAKIEASVAERQAARQEQRIHGEVKSSPLIATVIEEQQKSDPAGSGGHRLA